MTQKKLNGRQVIEGTVKSDKMDKTRVVTVRRTVKHPKYEKTLRVNKSYYVHDEKNETHTGDVVRFVGTRPLSKLKRWRLLEIVKRPAEKAAAEAVKTA